MSIFNNIKGNATNLDKVIAEEAISDEEVAVSKVFVANIIKYTISNSNDKYNTDCSENILGVCWQWIR